MNYAHARAVQTHKGWIGELRLSWKADYEPVLIIDENGMKKGPRYFDTQKDAELAAWRLKNTLEQSVMTRDGVRIGDLSEADAAFPGLRPMVRNGRKVEVERKGKRA